MKNELKRLFRRQNDFVDIKRIGAKGDGVADDTEALLKGMLYAIEHNKTVFIPKGIYQIQPNKIKIHLKNGQSLRIEGEGPETILKRQDWTTFDDWQILIAICSEKTNTKDVELVSFSHLKLDSNARNQQQPPTDPYDYEHCADICIYGSEKSFIQRVSIANLYADDGVADHLYIAGEENAYVRHLDINGFTVGSRSRMRSDICVTGGIESAYIRNVDCKSLEYEFNAPYDKGISKLKLEDIRTDNLDLTGADKDLEVAGSNIVSGHTYLGDLTGHLSNCTLTFEAREKLSPDEGRLYNMKNFLISDSVIKLTPVNGEIVPFRVTHKNTLMFKNVSFVVDDPARSFYGSLIEFEPTDVKSTLVEFDNCTFDERVDTAFRFNRCGNVIIRKIELNNPTPFRLYSSAELPLRLELQQIRLGENCRNSFVIESGEGLSLKTRKFTCGEKNFSILAENSSWSAYKDWSVERSILITAPLEMERLAKMAPEDYVILSKGDYFVYQTTAWKIAKTGEYRLSKPIAAVQVDYPS